MVSFNRERTAIQLTTWPDFKKFVDGTTATLAYFYTETAAFYRIVTEEYGGLHIEVTVNKDGGADVTDFESNYKNQATRLPATTRVKTEVQLDFDTGAGAQSLSLVGIALPASGGAVAGGTVTNPFRVDPTGTTTQPVSDAGGSLTVDGTITADQGTPAASTAPWAVRQSDGTSFINPALEHVTAGSPHSVRLSDGTSFYVSPTSSQFPASLVGGRLDVNLGAWLGSTAPTVGQKAMATSIPVAIASDQTYGFVSTANSTASTLTGGATFTGTSEDVSNYALAHVSAYASHASAVDGLSIEQSTNGTDWDFATVFSVPAGTGVSFSVPCAARYFRVRYTNGGTTQTAFRLQTVFKNVYGKPNVHRISDSISVDQEAELVASTLMARTPSGLFVPIEASDDKRLRVSSAVTPPANTTSVNRFADGSVNNNAVGEDVYTITNGATLKIQRFSGGGENSVAGGRVELAVRTGPVGSRVDTVIDVGYIAGGNFQFDLEVEYTGDTSSGVNRQIVLKRINLGGSSMRIKGRWEGYEE